MASNFTREELIELRGKAREAEKSVPNQDWKYAYNRLASAVDHLDAMIARTEVKV